MGVAGDQQASLDRPGLLLRRPGEMHLRHRRVPAGPYRRTGRALAAGLDHDAGSHPRRWPAQYALEGSVFVAGAAVQWFRDGLKAIGASPEINPLASNRTRRTNVIFVPALTGLGAPYWEPAARGAIFGLTRATGVADLARATLEGVAFQVADLIDAMTEDLGAPLYRYPRGRRDVALRSVPAVPGRSARPADPPQPPDRVDGPRGRAPRGLGAGLWPSPAAAIELLQCGDQTLRPGSRPGMARPCSGAAGEGGRELSTAMTQSRRTVLRLYLSRLIDLTAGKRGLGGGQPGDRHAERRAGNVVHPHLVAERDAVRVAAVLAADADLQVLAVLLLARLAALG